MKEHPIIFSGPMVRAILEGRKSQTRRIMKPQPILERGTWRWIPRINTDINVEHINGAMCPHGGLKDHLYIRETWADPGFFEKPLYRADFKKGQPRNALGNQAIGGFEFKWKPSIHMPKRFARIWLEIINVRVERIQDIMEEDARAEGIRPRWVDSTAYQNGFRKLWDDLNAKRGYGWDKNPWVWVIEFKKLNPAPADGPG